ncbi:MAG: response regulator, partial [Lachnospiraceae bacterium]|nr:response regulator [Lachnospiraceae bacterium]
LLGIVNDILDFSRIESGKLEIIPEVYELSGMLNDMMTMMLPKAEEKGLDFRIGVASDMPSRLFGDDLRIRQCCVNLLSNAIKYTQQGKVRMKLTYEEAGDDELFLKVSVTDTGIGIREEDIPRLTKPFERIEEDRNRSVEGTGLGMSITSNLLELMGSSLKVESEYGRGSTFSFVLKQKIVDRKPIGNFMEDYQKTAEQEEAYRERFHAPDVRILVVDDTPTNLTVIRGLLRKTGMQVDTVMSGKEMLEKVVEEYYDLIFLDQRMPVMDGIEALHLMELLAGRKNPDAPCIALTANAVSGAREMFLSEGFTDYMTKPVNPVKLEEMLLKYLPEEKVIRPDSPEFSGESKSSEEACADLEELAGERLRNIPGIDYEAAISRCMEDDILIEALKDFRLSAQHGPDEIERFMESGDIENYTIRVHGLKSSAAVVGAMVLSELAAELERCGKEGDTERIRKETPKLVAMYRDYAKQLSFLAEEENDTEKTELITPEKLDEAYSAIRDFLEAFDYESAEEVLNMLKAFAIPKSEQTRYNELREKISLLDRDGAIVLLGKPQLNGSDRKTGERI